MTDSGIGRSGAPIRESVEPLLPRFETALVPRNSISGRALVAVVAIMTFLVSLTTGAAVLVQSRRRMAVRYFAGSNHPGSSSTWSRS